MASEHIILRWDAAARREPPLPAGLTVWHCGEAVSLSAGFFLLPVQSATFSSVSKLSGSGQGFSFTSFETETAGWIHKRAVCWTFCLLTGRNIGSHQRVSGTGLPGAVPAGRSASSFVRDTETRELRSAGRHLASAWELCVSVTPSGPLENRCTVVRLSRYDSGGRTCLPVAAGFQESSGFWPWGCSMSIPHVRWG